MRQELKAEDFDQVESLEIAEILYVFPNFQTAQIGQKIRFSAAAELFRASISQNLKKQFLEVAYRYLPEFQYLFSSVTFARSHQPSVGWRKLETLTNYLPFLQHLK